LHGVKVGFSSKQAKKIAGKEAKRVAQKEAKKYRQRKYTICSRLA
jgi:hypothetical protein